MKTVIARARQVADDRRAAIRSISDPYLKLSVMNEEERHDYIWRDCLRESFQTAADTGVTRTDLETRLAVIQTKENLWPNLIAKLKARKCPPMEWECSATKAFKNAWLWGWYLNEQGLAGPVRKRTTAIPIYLMPFALLSPHAFMQWATDKLVYQVNDSMIARLPAVIDGVYGPRP